jgi:K+-sensing histidine kinase KdpD
VPSSRRRIAWTWSRPWPTSCRTLRDISTALSDAEKADLLATIIDESERLNRFIANLLDMTKLESGAIVPNTARHDLGEIIGSALRRASKMLARHHVELELAAGLPMLDLDAVLFEQVVFNILDNAAKYSPAGTTIRIQSWRDRDSISLQVLDEGDGIPPGARADLRQVLSRGKGRPGAGRHETWARDLAWLCRSHAWDHHRGEPRRSVRSGICDQAPDPAPD